MPDVTLNIPDELLQDLQHVAKYLDITIEAAILRAIEAYWVDDTPTDLAEAKIAAGLQDINAGNVHDFDDVMAEIRNELKAEHERSDEHSA